MAQIKPKLCQCNHCRVDVMISQINVITEVKYDGVSILDVRCPSCYKTFEIPKSDFDSEKDAAHRWTEAHFKPGQRAISKKTCLDKKYQNGDWAAADPTILDNLISNLEYLITLPKTKYLEAVIESDLDKARGLFVDMLVAIENLRQTEEDINTDQFHELLDRANKVVEKAGL